MRAVAVRLGVREIAILVWVRRPGDQGGRTCEWCRWRSVTCSLTLGLLLRCWRKPHRALLREDLRTGTPVSSRRLLWVFTGTRGNPETREKSFHDQAQGWRAAARTLAIRAGFVFLRTVERSQVEPRVDPNVEIR